MTSQSGKNRFAPRVRGAVVGGAVAVGLLIGIGASTAVAEPTSSTTEAEAPPTATMTADEALAIIAEDYDVGAGGGQLANLIHDVMTLRAQGFMPSKANRAAIQEALDYRPNQTPLVEALEDTLSYQRKIQAQAAQAQPTQGPGMGINQVPPGQQRDPNDPENSGIFIAPGGGSTINQPIG
ncbi:MAG: hypothetical protein ACRDU5_11475 [Mycobacterium sp.]